ncbi:MAG: peptidoglycan DD-metalloendopeptidase family protein [Sulfitobacter sp.]
MTRIARLILPLLLMLSSQASAQGDAAEQALIASDQLQAASMQLDAAEGARDRVRALTETIKAFETGLAALRSGLRRVTQREAQLSQNLQAKDAEVAQLLAVLQTIGRQDAPVAFLHPQGPTGTARASMLLAELTPALNARATALRQDLQDVQVLRRLQTDAEQRLQLGLKQIQTARSTLNQAIANRTELPRRFTADPVRTAILIASTETLDGFASGLSRIAVDDTGQTQSPLEDSIGDLPLPVQGLVSRRSGEADAAGVKRPGLILATRPNAIVTSPTAATIRYTGPLLDLGNVVILEPQADTLFVIAGLAVVYGNAGEVIAQGAPLGLMGDTRAKNGASLSTDGDEAGDVHTETLYVEVRQENIPEDPGVWFRTDKDG